MRKVERRLRERIKELEQQIVAKDADLNKFRAHFTKRLRWWIQLIGEKKTPSLQWLIEDDAKVLHDIKSWWW